MSLSKNKKIICENCDLLAIINNSFDGIYITDGQANTILINKNYEIITGLKKEDVIYKNMADLVKNKVISASGTLLAIKRKRAVTLQQEFETGRKALITSSPIFDKNGNISMVVTNVRDLTEIYELQEEIEKKNVLSMKTIAELDELKKKLNITKNIICVDKKSVAIMQLVGKVAKTDATVLLLGETGVGKDVFAQYIYENSLRKGKPFVRLNCGALSPSLIESELFGYEKGSFTGANKEGKPGLFEVAGNGTIFLDEIGELPIDMQVKLLRVLQEQEVIRIGGRTPIKVDVRVIAATNRNLDQLVKEKKFREDLYYRLTVFPVTIPPLRDRIADIVPLAKLFIDQFNEKYKFEKEFQSSTLKMLQNYNYPGNIRELKNIVERAFIISNDKTISIEDIPIKTNKYYDDSAYDTDHIDLKRKIESIELDYINAAYEKYNNVRDAAKSLNMDPSTYVRKRKKYQNNTNDA